MRTELDVDVMGERAELSATVGRLGSSADQLAAIARDLGKRLDREAYPVTADFTGSGVATAGTVVQIACYPTAPQGQFWALRRITVSAPDPTTSPQAGTAYIFVGVPPSGGSGVNTPTLTGARYIDKITTLPGTLYWSRFQVPVRYPEVVLVQIVPVTGSLTYLVNGTAEQAPDLTQVERTP